MLHKCQEGATFFPQLAGVERAKCLPQNPLAAVQVQWCDRPVILPARPSLHPALAVVGVLETCSAMQATLMSLESLEARAVEGMAGTHHLLAAVIAAVMAAVSHHPSHLVTVREQFPNQETQEEGREEQEVQEEGVLHAVRGGFQGLASAVANLAIPPKREEKNGKGECSLALTLTLAGTCWLLLSPIPAVMKT